jgi:KDO2-lipid IV(A) lauroyltransferase
MTPRFQSWQFRIETMLLRGAAICLPLLPYGLLRALAWGLGTLASLVDWRGRKTAAENLAHALPGLTSAERSRIRRKSYQVFGRTFAELFWGRNLTRENVGDYIEFCYETDAARRAVEGGCIFACPHVGNFEWLSLGTGLAGHEALIVAENFKNPALTELFRTLRQVTSHTIIPQEGSVLKLFRHLRRGGRTALLTDLNVAPDQSATVIQCFGLETCVTMAHAALAQKTGSPIVPCFCLPTSSGKHQLHYLEPILFADTDTLQSIAQRTWDRFEQAIRHQPEVWMWMYKHWRYLPEGADPTTYPSYANRSKKFDKLRRLMGVRKP